MRMVNFESLTQVLMARQYTQDYTPVPTKAIGAKLREEFDSIFNFVGEETPESFLVVRSTNGIFSNLYTPRAYRATPENFQKWAGYTSEYDSCDVGIRFTQDLVIPIQAFIDKGAEVELASNEEIAIFIPENEQYPEGLSLLVGLSYEDFANKPLLIAVNKAFKTKTLGKLLSPIKTGSQTIKLVDLGENTEHTVVGYQSKVSGSYGTYFVLELSDGRKVFANSRIESILNALPTINKDMPATLIISDITTTKNGNPRVNAVLLPSAGAFSEEYDFQLDW